MDATELRLEFDKQLKDADAKIAEAERNLQGLKEYKLKLQGGVETLELLNPKEPAVGGAPEPSTDPQPPEPPSTES